MQEFIKNLDLGAKGLWFPVAASVLFAITALIIPKKKYFLERNLYYIWGCRICYLV
ncbi:hypothetical protein F4694_001260 [Bacillus niacini]|uniref:Uncharacterized protein n=1 Tax=Neobacillus niacini TaxID=86668 RepID=A0A852T9P6_9BACI|nr:hypothetical protein [Neobacillus niacini]